MYVYGTCHKVHPCMSQMQHHALSPEIEIQIPLGLICLGGKIRNHPWLAGSFVKHTIETYGRPKRNHHPLSNISCLVLYAQQENKFRYEECPLPKRRIQYVQK